MQPAKLRFEVVQQRKVTVFRPVGWISTEGHAQMEERMKELVTAGCKRLVVDLSAAHVVSSTALGVFLYYKKLLEDAGGGLLLAAPAGAARKMLAVSGLDRSLDIFATLAEAVARASSSTSSRRQRAK